ncbi:clan AA aspartic protease [Campylobacter taeniopygiae]|uniref:clan AA aspartic protease n=1 Tax=Campylobacter taeniopygiae TaxID=2510188 RepID=UPI003D6BD9ED
MLFLLKKILPQIFIGIILEDKKNILKAAIYRNKKLISSSEKIFEKSEDLLEYVKTLSKKFLFFHTALFLNAKEQGLIPNTKNEDLEKFNVGKISLKFITLNNALTYTATEHVEYFHELFEDYNGLDFLYSPFALLYFNISKQNKNDDKITLYAYQCRQMLTIMVCKNHQILYGELIFLDQESENNEISNEELDEDIFNNELNFENLDENFEDLSQEKNDSEEEGFLNFDNLSQFNNDIEIAHCIISSIEKFYNDEKYSGNFINNIHVLSEQELSIEATEFLENETFLEITTQQINTFDLMFELMHKEIQ